MTTIEQETQDGQDQHSYILRWISGLTDDPEVTAGPSSKTTSPKAKAVSRSRKRPLPSPSMSDDQQRSVTPQKRHRIDLEATPKASWFPAESDASSNASTSGYGSPSSRHSKRARSKQSSPTKNITYLRIEHVLRYESFDGSVACSLPPSLTQFVQLIEADGYGQGIISPPDMEQLKANAVNDPLFAPLFASPRYLDDTGTRETLGDSLGTRRAIKLLRAAQECEQRGHSEASWNCAVHYPLLDSALELSSINSNNQRNSKIQIGCANATTAQIASVFAPATNRRKHDKRIDFCLYLDIPEDHPARGPLQATIRRSQLYSINHTDYAPLLDRPICLSIETKRTGEDWQAALEQIGVWLTAQWRCIDFFTIDSKPPPIDFLPALIIQGHDWWFLASSRTLRPDGTDEIVIWNKVLIGSTSSVRGFYQIVTTLQRLVLWSNEVYWPWFQAAILGSHPPNSSTSENSSPPTHSNERG